jgi:hypothetical protein
MPQRVLNERKNLYHQWHLFYLMNLRKHFMKIRIADNSIRFRLRQPEVKSLQEKGLAITVLALGITPESKLTFQLQKTNALDVAVTYKLHHVAVNVPIHLCNEWFNTDLVGIEANVETEQDHFVHVLIEKDFACLDASVEENEGAYENPKSIC